MPDTLQGVMMARLDQLVEQARRTAQIASVVGRTFSYDIMTRLHTDPALQLHRWLAALQRHDVVRETERAPQLAYAFSHNLMQEVCYNSLLARIRRTYHLMIADYVEAAAPHDEASGSHVALVAYHAYAGQDWPRALKYQLEAGEQARRLFANAEAIEHFSRAEYCTEQLPDEETFVQRLRIQSVLGELLTVTSQYDQAQQHLFRAEELATSRHDCKAQARTCRWLAHLHELRGAYAPAFAAIERGLRCLGNDSSVEAAELRLIAGIIHTRQGDYGRALNECESALALARQSGDLAVLARSYNLLGIIRLRNQPTLALADFRQSLILYSKSAICMARPSHTT